MMPFAVQVHHAFVDGIHIDKKEQGRNINNILNSLITK